MTEEFVENARARTTHDEIYDLEDSHSAAEPRVRRIKTPHQWHESYARVVAHPNILAALRQLWGPAIRFDVSKLNLKAAGYGAPVEWHQDWAFYPHTNDDLAAVGIMLDDVDATNGPLMVIPGSHKGPILDHHDDQGFFCGAIDPARGECDFGEAVKLTGKAGSITIHHARTIHGSATNTSGRPRRLLLHQYRAADAWPILGVPDYAAWRACCCAARSASRASPRRRSACRCRRPRIRARSTRTSAPARAASSRPRTSSSRRSAEPAVCPRRRRRARQRPAAVDAAGPSRQPGRRPGTGGERWGPW